jgi:hypothetical protein
MAISQENLNSLGVIISIFLGISAIVDFVPAVSVVDHFDVKQNFGVVDHNGEILISMDHRSKISILNRINDKIVLHKEYFTSPNCKDRNNLKSIESKPGIAIASVGHIYDINNKPEVISENSLATVNLYFHSVYKPSRFEYNCVMLKLTDKRGAQFSVGLPLSFTLNPFSQLSREEFDDFFSDKKISFTDKIIISDDQFKKLSSKTVRGNFPNFLKIPHGTVIVPSLTCLSSFGSSLCW